MRIEKWASVPQKEITSNDQVEISVTTKSDFSFFPPVPLLPYFACSDDHSPTQLVLFLCGNYTITLTDEGNTIKTLGLV